MRRIAALLSFSVALAVFQSTDEAAAAVQTYRPSADTYVNEARPNKTFGSAGRLYARAGSRPAKQVFIRFVVAGLDAPVTHAKLRFYVSNGAAERARRLPNRALAEPAAHVGTAARHRQRPPRRQGRAREQYLGGMGRDPVDQGNGGTGSRSRVTGQTPLRFMSQETTRQPQLVVTTSEPPSTVVYVTPLQGDDRQRDDDGTGTGTGRDRLDRRLRMRRRVGRRGSRHQRERGVVGAMGYAGGRLLQRHTRSRGVGVP